MRRGTGRGRGRGRGRPSGRGTRGGHSGTRGLHRGDLAAQALQERQRNFQVRIICGSSEVSVSNNVRIADHGARDTHIIFI